MTSAAFDHIEMYRAELKAHCYRMLGSAFEAEDAVQEAFVRAWRSSGKFEGRTTLRGWLYRIATNVCLTMLSRAKIKRLTPYLSSPAATDFPRGPSTEVSWLEPYPQTFLNDVPDGSAAPHARYEQKEATELAFVAAIAYLPAKQRAVLLLHDVLGWSAQETAHTLETSAASVNSALQRARETLRKKLPQDHSALRKPATTQAQNDLLGQYVKAWDSHDIRALVTLLKDDAILSMPPVPQWYRGRDQVIEIFEWGTAQLPFTEWHAVPTSANYDSAILLYGREHGSPTWIAHAIHVLEIRGGQIAAVHNFMDRALFKLWGDAPPS